MPANQLITAEQLKPNVQLPTLEAPQQTATIDVPEQVKRRAGGDFSQDPLIQYFEDARTNLQKRSENLKQLTQQRQQQALQQAIQESEQLQGIQTSRLARLGALGATASGATAQAGLAASESQRIAQLRSQQALELAQVDLSSQQQEIDLIGQKYGAQAEQEARAIATQLEVAKQNAQIQQLNQEQSLAVQKFNADMQRMGIEIAQQNARDAGFVMTNDGQLVPTLQKEQQVQQQVEQDRRYKLDEQKFQAERQQAQQALSLQAAELTGELEGVKTLASRNLELEQLKVAQSIQQFKQQQALAERKTDIEEFATEKQVGLAERKQSFDEALNSAKQLLNEKVANKQIEKTDADIIIGNLEQVRKEKLTNQQIRESQVNNALKISQDLRAAELQPFEIDKLKAQAESLKASALQSRAAAAKSARLTEKVPTLKVIGGEFGYVTTNEAGEPVFKSTGRVAADPTERKNLTQAYNELIDEQDFNVESAVGLYAASGGTIDGFISSIKSKDVEVQGDDLVDTRGINKTIGKVIRDSQGNIVDVIAK